MEACKLSRICGHKSSARPSTKNKTAVEVLPPIKHAFLLNRKTTHEPKGLETSKNASVLFDTNLSEYVKRPSYFCHPVVIPTSTTNQRRSSDMRAAPQCPNPSTRWPEKSNNVNLSRNEIFKTRPLGKDKNVRLINNLDNISDAFRAFCKSEGFNLNSPLSTKIMGALCGAKKFGKVSAQQFLPVIPEDEAVILNFYNRLDDLIPQDKVPREQKPIKQRRSLIKDAARSSAAKGQVASTKALSYILNQPDRKSKSCLPPLKKVPLITSFDNVWKPNSSLVIRKQNHL